MNLRSGNARLKLSHKKWGRMRDEGFLHLLESGSPNSTVVDLGCGDGEFTIRAKEQIGQLKIFGVDIYPPNVSEATKKGVTVLSHDLNSFPYPFENNMFDVVITNQLIEHLYYPVKFMREIHRILKPNGYSVISTENFASWDNIFALTLGYTPFSMSFDSGLMKIANPFSPHEKQVCDIEENPHLRILTLKGLIALSKYVDFTVEKAVGVGHIFDRLGDKVDKTHCRFITVKVRKQSSSSLQKISV